MKSTVAVGLIGPVLDSGKGNRRWERWRPTIALCQHEDLLIDKFELLYQRKFKSLMEQLSQDIKNVSPETEIVPHEIDFDDPWDFEEVYGALHDFARSYPFDPENNDYLVHITTGTHVAQICLYLLTESNYFPGRLIQTSPSSKRDKGIHGKFSIIDLDLSKYDQIAMRFQQEVKDDLTFLKSGIDTRNPEFNRLIERVEKVAIHSVDPIYITGPTGAGKSKLARRIFELKKSRRQIQGEFVEVNCATLRGDSAMSALFGHKKGSFTGAEVEREGLLKTADKGILFLDEIGELGLDEQAMLLRSVEEKKFLPVGADKESESDFQLICGTNRDLKTEVQKGLFREDLLARINLWSFEMPGLKDRPEDIEPNLIFELDSFAERSGNRITFNKEAWKKFIRFSISKTALWAANFRDLNGAVIRMATLAPGGRINTEVVDEEIARLRKNWQVSLPDNNVQIIDEVLGEGSSEQIDLFEINQLSAVLKVCRESKTISEAGRKLFSVSRENKKKSNDADRLRKYLAKYNISWNEIT